MKQLKKLITICLFVSLLFFYSCADWLDVAPIDRVLEERQFATEDGINSALNGVYRSMAHNNLYGELLTQTFIEYMARYYNFWNLANVPTALVPWSQIARWQYQEDAVKSRALRIWEHAFATILEINVFLDNVRETDVVHPSRRDVMLGEAYALRAFLHFDMFRLFGPIMRLEPDALSIPFADSRQTVSRERLPASALINRVLQDLETAERLLENDPVRTRGVNDNFHQVSTNPTLTSIEINEAHFRNRRMNYYAVRALRARVLLHAGRFAEARELAREVLGEATRDFEGDGRFFQWERNWNQILQTNNFMFYNEVLFGITNPNQHSNWTRLFDGTRQGYVHVVVAPNLFGNILGNAAITDLSTIVATDIRAGQWRQSNVLPGTSTGTGAGITFISTKFRQPVIENWNVASARYMIDFQPLIRISELPLIIAEAYIAEAHNIEDGDTQAVMQAAANAINIVRENRRAIADQLATTINDVPAYLMRQIYAEFVGEGQAFFFLKRNAKTRIFSGFNATQITINEADLSRTFVVPLPDSEIMI